MTGLHLQTFVRMVRTGVVRGRRMPSGSFVLSRDEVLIDIARHRHEVAQQYRDRGERRRGVPLGPHAKTA